MKAQWILPACVILIVLALQSGCAPAVPSAAEQSTSGLSSQVPITTEVTTDKSTGTQSAPIIPTLVKTETKTVNDMQVETPSGSESSAGVTAARQDLARRLGIAVDGIKVSAVIGQEFTSEAFYCRTPKEIVSNVETPAEIAGFSILLNISGRRYEYHASGQTVIFCRPL